MNKAKIKLENGAVLPFYAKAGDVGADLTATSLEIIMVNNEPVLMYGTGISIEPPAEFEIQLRSRSSIGTKTNLQQTNGVGTVDEGYRGELKFCFALRGFVMPNEDEEVAYVIKKNILTVYYSSFSTMNDSLVDVKERNFKIYEVGERIGQMILKTNDKIDSFEVVGGFDATERGEGGFGSTGK